MAPSTPDSFSEKPEEYFKENATTQDIEFSSTTAPAAAFSAEREKKLLRKIDIRLLIILGAIYAVSLIDRTNISIARVAGMGKDLQLTVGERYSIITAVFFPPYVVFELPSNMALRKVGCRVWLSLITVLWGGVMLGMAFLTNWHQLLVCRVLLGVLEAGFFPGCVYLISCWYTRAEVQKRIAAFYLTAMVISGFSNLIGYGMSLMNGIAGLEGWRWIFLLFGILTIALGLLAMFLIVDFPDKNKFLTHEETTFVLDRINRDRGDAEADALTASKFFKHCSDFKLWVFGLAFCFTTMPVYAFSYFLPVILKAGGFDTKLSLSLSAPPYAVAAAYTFGIAYLADKTRQRALFISVNALVCLIGVAIMAWGGKVGVRYFGCFLAIGGAQANVPSILAYQANNIRSQSKRAVAAAIVIGGGGVGGIFASLVYRQIDAPKYMPGLAATIGCQVAIVIMCAGLSMYFRNQNAKAERGEKVLENSASFRYTI